MYATRASTYELENGTYTEQDTETSFLRVMSVKAVSGVQHGNSVFGHTTPTPSASEAAEATGVKINIVVRVIRSFLGNHRMFVRGFVEDHRKLVGWDSGGTT